MRIQVRDLGKKFNKEWIFRHLDAEFDSNSSYAITGPNGSGKSTLLQILTGFFPQSEGELTYITENGDVPVENYYRYLDIVTPYLEIIEEFTLKEFLSFHFKFKQLKVGFTPESFVNRVYLEKDVDKIIRNFSSGMKQRLKLGLAFYSESPVCFLDEPTSNLDEFGIGWYAENVREIEKEKLLVISSNQKHEYEFCENTIHIPDYK